MSVKQKLFDRSKIASNLAHNNNSGQIDFITEIMLEDLAHRLGPISRKFNRALIIAPDTKHLPKNLDSLEGKIDFSHAPTLIAPPQTSRSLISRPDTKLYDAENLQLPHNDYDLIISLFDLGFTDNVPRFINQIRKNLIPDGLFLAAFIGGTSLSELRAAWLEADAKHLGGAIARIPPFIDIKDAGSLLQSAGFALPVCDKETLNLSYKTPLHLMREIKALGASSPLYSPHRAFVGKNHLDSVIKAYQRSFSADNNRVKATIEIIWMSGWVPHESQQKPMKPGSAQISFAKFLGDKSG